MHEWHREAAACRRLLGAYKAGAGMPHNLILAHTGECEMSASLLAVAPLTSVGHGQDAGALVAQLQ